MPEVRAVKRDDEVTFEDVKRGRDEDSGGDDKNGVKVTRGNEGVTAVSELTRSSYFVISSTISNCHY